MLVVWMPGEARPSDEDEEEEEEGKGALESAEAMAGEWEHALAESAR